MLRVRLRPRWWQQSPRPGREGPRPAGAGRLEPGGPRCRQQEPQLEQAAQPAEPQPPWQEEPQPPQPPWREEPQARWPEPEPEPELLEGPRRLPPAGHRRREPQAQEQVGRAGRGPQSPHRAAQLAARRGRQLAADVGALGQRQRGPEGAQDAGGADPLHAGQGRRDDQRHPQPHRRRHQGQASAQGSLGRGFDRREHLED
mmetsp:Transcript_112874/g.353019  ORF Transcript_112874/g.353019 Transcript_112874/m.353019 type:complete len:201 (+) Transcript_112874:815-1417(+)